MFDQCYQEIDLSVKHFYVSSYLVRTKLDISEYLVYKTNECTLFKITTSIRIFLSQRFFMNSFFSNRWNHFHALLQPIWMFRGFKSVWRSIYNAYALALFTTLSTAAPRNGRPLFFCLVQHCSKSFLWWFQHATFFQTWSILSPCHVFRNQLVFSLVKILKLNPYWNYVFKSLLICGCDIL